MEITAPTVLSCVASRNKQRADTANKTPNGCAPGYRARDTGNLTYVGDSGFSWSFTGSETYSIFLNFGIQNLNPSYTRYRGYGLQLRCLSEVRVALTNGRVYPK